MAQDVENLTLTMLRDMRREQVDQRTLLLGLVDQLRRMENRFDARFLSVEQRFASLRDDLELMIKSEIMGRLTHFETIFEQRLETLTEQSREPRI